MTMREALDEARQSASSDEAIRALVRRGVWIADENAMADAVHRVYCGMIADHEHPNEKDRDQARQLIAAIGEAIGTGA